MLTTIEVVVEELCNNTVPNTPIMRPATGLDRISFSANACPAALPVNYNKRYLWTFCIPFYMKVYCTISNIKNNFFYKFELVKALVLLIYNYHIEVSAQNYSNLYKVYNKVQWSCAKLSICTCWFAVKKQISK